MYVIRSPSFGVVLFTVNTVTKLASETNIDAFKSSPAVVGSAWSPAAAVVVFVMVEFKVPPFTDADISIDALAFEAKLPIVQTPVPET